MSSPYYGGSSTGPTMPVVSVVDVANLRLVTSNLLIANQVARIVSGAQYEWTPASMAADDGIYSIKPADIGGGNPGRWILTAYWGNSIALGGAPPGTGAVRLSTGLAITGLDVAGTGTTNLMFWGGDVLTIGASDPDLDGVVIRGGDAGGVGYVQVWAGASECLLLDNTHIDFPSALPIGFSGNPAVNTGSGIWTFGTLTVQFGKALVHPSLKQEQAADDTAGGYWQIRGQDAGLNPTAARGGGPLYIYAGDGAPGGATWAAGVGGSLGFYAGKPGTVGAGGGGVGGSIYFSSAAGTGVAAAGTINFNASHSASWACSGINFTNITDNAPLTNFGTLFQFAKTQIGAVTINHETDTTIGGVRPAMHIQAQSTTVGAGTGATLSLESGDGPTHGGIQFLLGGPAGTTVFELTPSYINFGSGIGITASGNPTWAFGTGGTTNAGAERLTPTNVHHTASPYAILTTDRTLLCNTDGAALTLTLPAVASSSGRRLTALDWAGTANVHAVTIAAQAGETVNGLASIDIVTLGGGCDLYCDGVVWQTIKTTV